MRSASNPNQVVPSGSTSRMSTPATTGSGALSASKEAILTLLGISTHLGDRSDHSLHVSYQKYRAHLEATQTYERMVADGTWIGNKLSAVDFIELFVSKSFWHSHVKKYFSKVSDHPLMVEWLENGAHRPSDVDVWGFEKSSYTFKDLDAYLQQAASKGKKKAKGDKGKGDKKDGHKKTKKHVN
jgi:hypothetical protein